MHDQTTLKLLIIVSQINYLPIWENVKVANHYFSVGKYEKNISFKLNCSFTDNNISHSDR